MQNRERLRGPCGKAVKDFFRATGGIFLRGVESGFGVFGMSVVKTQEMPSESGSVTDVLRTSGGVISVR